MVKKFPNWMLLAAGLVFLASCSDRVLSPTPPGSTQGGMEADSKPLQTPTVDVCDPVTLNGVVFPRQAPVEGPREVMEAELVGVLQLAEGCLRVQSLYGQQSYLPVWPPGFTTDAGNGFPVVRNEEGKVVGRVGEEIYMGGGSGTQNSLMDCVRQQLPEGCQGPYWVVGEGVRLNLVRDSEYFTLQVFTQEERSVILLNHKEVLQTWVNEDDLVSGQLVLYEPLRCPRIQSESGVRDYLPIWPAGYRVEFQDGQVQVVDPDGNTIAEEGQSLVLAGGLVPHSWDSAEYRQLHSELPGDCTGPYWIVADPGE